MNANTNFKLVGILAAATLCLPLPALAQSFNEQLATSTSVIQGNRNTVGSKIQQSSFGGDGLINRQVVEDVIGIQGNDNTALKEFSQTFIQQFSDPSNPTQNDQFSGSTSVLNGDRNTFGLQSEQAATGQPGSINRQLFEDVTGLEGADNIVIKELQQLFQTP